MQHHKSENASSSDKLEAVFQAVETTQAGILNLMDCLRREREYVTFFDVASLMEVLEEKSRIIDLNNDAALTQSSVIRACWKAEGPTDQPMPQDTVQALKALASAYSGTDRQDLLDAASELDALRGAAMELHSVNEGLLNRAVSWITAYVSELVDTTSVGTYDMSGRVTQAGKAGSLLSRKVG